MVELSLRHDVQNLWHSIEYLDYNSEKILLKNLRLVNSLVPISIALFANSSIVEKKIVAIYLIDQKFGKNTSRGGLTRNYFLINLNFEKYAEFAMNFPMLFIQNEKKYYISGRKYILF